MDSEYKGVDAIKPTDHNLYCFPVDIFSQDENSTERRCGNLTLYENIADAWMGTATFHLFTDTWKPNAGEFDPSAEVVGKTCFQFEWTSQHTYNIATDHSTMKNVRKIGTIVDALPGCNLVAVKLDADFVNTREFLEEGVWISGGGYMNIQR